jgi:beta-glucosidase
VSSSTTRCDPTPALFSQTPDTDIVSLPRLYAQWFDAKDITPRFPFGFGLSYSSFEYSNATIKEAFAADSDYVQLTNEAFDGETALYDTLYEVGVTVTNIGDITAAEVAQVVSLLLHIRIDSSQSS